MKVLFLDIDGVLNGSYTKEKIGCFDGLQGNLVARLLEWLKKYPEVKVVMSSSWRYAPEHMKAIKDAGINYIGITPKLNLPRGVEVEAWLQGNPGVTHYAILDDNADFQCHQLPFFVQTSYVKGLRGKDLVKLTRILELDHD